MIKVKHFIKFNHLSLEVQYVLIDMLVYIKYKNILFSIPHHDFPLIMAEFVYTYYLWCMLFQFFVKLFFSDHQINVEKPSAYIFSAILRSSRTMQKLKRGSEINMVRNVKFVDHIACHRIVIRLRCMYQYRESKLIKN